MAHYGLHYSHRSVYQLWIIGHHVRNQHVEKLPDIIYIPEKLQTDLRMRVLIMMNDLYSANVDLHNQMFTVDWVTPLI